MYDKLERDQGKVEEQTAANDGVFVKTDEAIRYYESVKKIVGAADIGPYFQAMGVFSDGSPIPSTFDQFAVANPDGTGTATNIDD